MTQDWYHLILVNTHHRFTWLLLMKISIILLWINRGYNLGELCDGKDRGSGPSTPGLSFHIKLKYQACPKIVDFDWSRRSPDVFSIWPNVVYKSNVVHNINIIPCIIHIYFPQRAQTTAVHNEEDAGDDCINTVVGFIIKWSCFRFFYQQNNYIWLPLRSGSSR